MRKRIGSEGVRTVESGRHFVQSGSDPSVWYGVIDGICECKGFQHRQKCKHVEELVNRGLLNPAQVDGYQKNRQYPPIKLADPSVDWHDMWVARTDHPIFKLARSSYYRVCIEDIPHDASGYLNVLVPDAAIAEYQQDDPHLFVDAYRQQLNMYGPDHIGSMINLVKASAKERPVVFVSRGPAVGTPDSFANPRRIFSTWWYERTGQAVPEMTGASNG